MVSPTTVLSRTGNDARLHGFAAIAIVLVAALPTSATAATLVPAASLQDPRHEHTATLLDDGTVLMVGGFGNGFLKSAELFDPHTGAVRSVGSLEVARSGHTATLLQDGTVLIAGGFTSTPSGGIAETTVNELYDPRSGSFQSTGSLSEARMSHTATRLRDGRVLITGGETRAGLRATAELYDPASGEFSFVGPLSAGRTRHNATLLTDGRVLVSGHLSKVELFDPQTMTFSDGPSYVGANPGSATLLRDGRVLLVGTSAFIYDPALDATGTISPTGPLLNPRSAGVSLAPHTSTLLPDGTVLIAGGNQLQSTEIYHPDNGEFTAGPPFAGIREWHSATLLHDGRVLMAGGADGMAALSSMVIYVPHIGFAPLATALGESRTGHTVTVIPTPSVAGSPHPGRVLICGGGPSLTTALIYDASTELMTAASESLNIGRSGHSATLLHNGKILIAGGSQSDARAELYDVDTGVFSLTGSLQSSRSGHTATLLPDGKVLLVGAAGPATRPEIFDPESGTFRLTGSVVAVRTSHTATLLSNGKVLIVGGFTSGGGIAGNELYDPRTDTFTPTGNLRNPRAEHTATLLPSGKVLITGGRIPDDTLPGFLDILTTAEIYDPATGIFSVAGEQAHRRTLHDAVLLPQGQVLLVGYATHAELYDTATGTFVEDVAITESESATLLPNGQVLILSPTLWIIYDAGLRYQAAWRPAVASTPASIAQSAIVTVQGSSFIGASDSAPEGSSGSTNSSSTNHPLLQLRRVDNGETIFLPIEAFTNAGFTSSGGWLMNPGPIVATVFTNGVPSIAAPLILDCGVAIEEQPVDKEVSAGAEVTFEVSAIAAVAFQWQKDSLADENWVDIPGATLSSYTTRVSGAESGSRFRVEVRGTCNVEHSIPAKLTITDTTEPWGDVISPSGGEYWLLSTADKESRQIIAWTAEDDIRICRIEVALLSSSDGGQTYARVPNGLLGTFGPGGSCVRPVEERSLTYTVPDTFPSGTSGSLYKVEVTVIDQDEKSTSLRSEHPFNIVQPNLDSVRTVILMNLPRMNLSSADHVLLTAKLHELANHPLVQGVVIDLSNVETINDLYALWDAASHDPLKANNVLFDTAGIHAYLRTVVLPAYTGVQYLVLVGDDRVIPMARMRDNASLLPESTYTEPIDPKNLSSTLTTVGQALESGHYLSDDPLAVRDQLLPGELNGSLFLPDLAVGRLVETPQQIVTTIATFIAQGGVVDLTASTEPHKVLVTGYDFLSNVAAQIRERWKSALGVETPHDSLSPVDGSLVGGHWGLDSVALRKTALRDRLAGNGGRRYAVMSLSGHATHYEEGVPGTDPFDINGLSTADIFGVDACMTSSPGPLNLSGSVIYAVGCHGGLSVPGSCRNDTNHSLDLPETFLARGAVAYVANTGYGWGLRFGIGYGARLVQIFTEQISAAGTTTVGRAVNESKRQYFLEAPRYDAYDEKTLMQWSLYGLPMYGMKVGPAASTLKTTTESTRPKLPVGVESHARVETNALPPSLTQLNLSFDFTAAGVYQKYNSAGTLLPDSPGCPDALGCYYTLNGLVDRGTGAGDLPIQPYLIYDSRLVGTSQHGVLWKGGTYDEENGWTPVIAQLASNSPDNSNHGAAPRQIMLRPTAPRVVPGVDPPECRASDLEINTLTVTTGEAVKDNPAEPFYTTARRYRNLDLEVFYYNNRATPLHNCDRLGPELGAGPFHTVNGMTISWSVPATDANGVWRVLVVYNTNTTDSSRRGTWIPLELTASGGAFTGSTTVSAARRLTYVVQAVDNRGNVTWLDYSTADLPASGVPLGVPLPVDVNIGNPIAAPANVIASATSASAVSVTWSAVADAASYDVYRRAAGTSYLKVGSSSSTSFNDATVGSGNAYLYAVRAVDGTGSSSYLSLPDLATAITFTDATLIVNSTAVRAIHLTELRSAVNAVRALAGFQSFPFADPVIAAQTTPIRATHVAELRSALHAARSALGMPAPSYIDPNVGPTTVIKAAHMGDVRMAVR